MPSTAFEFSISPAWVVIATEATSSFGTLGERDGEIYAEIGLDHAALDALVPREVI